MRPALAISTAFVTLLGVAGCTREQEPAPAPAAPPPAATPAPAPAAAAAVIRDSADPLQHGRYLVETVAGCGNCHTPRLPDGTPDLSGVWVGAGPIGDISMGLLPGEEIVLLPAAEALMKSRQAAEDPEARCLPTGVPRIAPYPWRLVQSPAYGKATHLFFLFEGNIHSFRQIFMDGRAHPDDEEPSWYGHSVGHWEGDTLVIDSVGFNESFWMDRRGMPHTNQLHTIERFTRKNSETIAFEITVDDPGAYTAPWTGGFDLGFDRGVELFEYSCQQANYAVELMVGGGRSSIDRTSPIVP